MTFVQKSYGEYSKVKKPVLVTMSYERSDDEDELETVPIISKNNNYNVISDSNSDNNIKNDNKIMFDEDINDEVESIPKTTINAKVVQAMKKLQASYNDNANKSSTKLCKKTIPSKI